MLLQDKYYKITSLEQSDHLHATYHVELIPDCDIYRGHFPGKPVCPGICNIEMIRELAIQFTHKNLRPVKIRRCRFLTVATPDNSPKLDVVMELTPEADGYKTKTVIKDATHVYVEFEGLLIESKP